MNTTPLRRPLTVIGGLVLLLLLALGVRLLTGPAQAADKKAKGAPPPVPVTTVSAKSQDVPIYRAGIGSVTAAASVTVKARIDGQLDKVGFTEGQDVKAGQVLAQLDPRTLRAQLGQAQAQKARDEAQLANARLDLQRYTRLVGEDAATPQQVDTQKSLVAQLEAAVKTDQAAIDYAQVQLSFTTITAPMSGRVGARLVDPGNIVHAADTNGLVVINQIDPISVVFTLPEDAVQDIHQAQQGRHSAQLPPLEVDAFSRDGRTPLGKGKLVLLNNQIDTTTGTVQLKGSFPNPDRTLWPGQFVNVRLQLGQHDQAVTVPDAAVQRGNDGTYVYVVGADRKARTQAVQVGQIQDGVAVIRKGLNAGDRVVVAGQYKLKPGLQVAEAPAAGASGAAPRAASGTAAGSGAAR